MVYEKRLFLIEKALRDGFKVTVEFMASTPKNEPLGFSCKGFFSNKKVSLNFQNTHLPHINARCKAEGLIQIISWPDPYHLFSFGEIGFEAVEKNLLFADKKFRGSISINKEDLLQLYQKKQATFLIQGSDYSIRFTRLP
ncbi:MAG: hypothetical protein GY786_04730 [Proteobacteria bacterium]|nr:hypothetical protein [Pseudomonadota bacterium]